MARRYDQNFYGLLQALLDVIAELAVMRSELDAIQALLGGGGDLAIWGSITGTLSAQSDLNSALGGKQSSSAELTGLSAVSTTGLIERTGLGTYATTPVTSYIKGLLDDVSAADARTTLGLVIGTNVQAYSARLDEITTAYAGATNGYVIRKKLDGTGLEFAVNTASVAWGGITGALSSQTDLQAALDGKQGIDADLTALAGLSGVGLIERTGAGTATTNTVTSYIKTLLDDATASEARTTLGLAIGTDVQAFNARLGEIGSAFAGASNGQFIRKKADGTGLEYATVTASTAWGGITGTLSSQTDLQTALDAKQDLDSDLTAIAGLATTGLIERTGSGTASTTAVTSYIKTLLDDADAVAARSTLGLVIGTNVQAYDADLDAIAGLSTTGLIERTGAGTASIATITTFGKSLIDDADASAGRTTLGLVIGTDVQAFNARLGEVGSAFAGATNGHFIRKNAGGTALEYASPIAPYLLYANQQASGTAGGTATSGAWRTLTLNTEIVDTDNLGTLASNEVTLLAGTYRCLAKQAFARTAQSQIRIFDVTNNVAAPNQANTNVYCDTTAFYATVWAEAVVRVTIASSTAFRLEYRTGATRATDGLGIGSFWGTETYTTLEIWKEG